MEDKYINDTVVLMFGSTVYENVICDNEITECNGVSFDAPMKFIYDPTKKIYYIIIKASPKNEEKIGDDGMVFVHSSQFDNGDVDMKTKLNIIGNVIRSLCTMKFKCDPTVKN